MQSWASCLTHGLDSIVDNEIEDSPLTLGPYEYDSTFVMIGIVAVTVRQRSGNNYRIGEGLFYNRQRHP